MITQPRTLAVIPALKLDKQSAVVASIVGFGILAGAAFVFVRILVRELTPLQLVGARTATGAFAVMAFVSLSRASFRVSLLWTPGVILLALLDSVIPYLLIAYGQAHVTSATTAILVATMPLFTTLFASVAGQGQAPHSTAVAGVLAGFGGVAILVGPKALTADTSATPSLIALLIAASCYAAGTVHAKNLLKHDTPLALTAAKLVVSAALVLPIALTVDGGGNFTAMSSGGYASLVALGFGSTGLARCVYLWAVSESGSVRASLVTYIAPVAAIILGWVILHETPALRELAGALLVIGGVFWVIGNPAAVVRKLAKTFLAGHLSAESAPP
jgi:drug/metabolite transporter (DMT)-like permease